MAAMTLLEVLRLIWRGNLPFLSDARSSEKSAWGDEEWTGSDGLESEDCEARDAEEEEEALLPLSLVSQASTLVLR